MRQPDWSALLLADLNGRVMAVIPEADAAEAGAFATGWAQAVAATKGPVVSKLFKMPGVHGNFLMIGVPIVRDGKVTLALGARVRSDSFGALLRQQQVPPNGTVALIDAANRIVARNRDEEIYVGTPISASLRRHHLARGRGELDDGAPRRDAGLLGVQPLGADRHLTVALALPREEVDGPVRRIAMDAGRAPGW